ncbi:uncharacterized protein LOC141834448 [Curcuma longa]|uniref:uncharacterized protein LOC141834448 n=1 Tax=Curcuma longa TaxID=136217 RepID=UPI003D9E2B5D
MEELEIRVRLGVKVQISKHPLLLLFLRVTFPALNLSASRQFQQRYIVRRSLAPICDNINLFPSTSCPGRSRIHRLSLTWRGLSLTSNHSPVDASSSSCDEESGWTTYFEDFMASEERRRAAVGSSSGVAVGNSMISDAASCVSRKTGQPPPAAAAACIEVSEKYKNLSLSRRKGRRLLEDDALEDTASSPVNSPKVTNLSATSSKKDDNRDTDLQDGVGRGNDPETKEFLNGVDFGERTSECAELRKSGLCLVPLSVIDDFLV